MTAKQLAVVAAHRQIVTNRYLIAYPDHQPRKNDPHKVDFDAWKRRQRKLGKWRCAWAAEVDDDSECDLSKPLEAHHSHLELALLNSVSYKRLEHFFPGISDPVKAGAWIDGDLNLILYCARHHRSLDGGVHHLDAAIWESAKILKPGTLLTAPRKAA